MTRRSHRRKKKAGGGSPSEVRTQRGITESSEVQIRDAETVRLVMDAISGPCVVRAQLEDVILMRHGWHAS